MNRFEVWAPLVSSVAVRTGNGDTSMQSHANGYWSALVENADYGSRYQFVIEGEAYADPRSPWQPEGIHGPSALIDHSSFLWSDDAWHAPPLKSAITYELHIGTFTPEGTFDSAIARLDHLVDLGVTHVELMPVNEFSGGHGWGYDGVNLYAPHHCYGGPEGLKRFVDACHSRGLAAILDVVYNHLGPVGNSLARFGPYFTSHYTTPWGPAVNLDQSGCDEVRRFLCDNALMWLRDYHFDALRLDAIHAFVDTSPRHLLEQLSEEVESLEAHLGRNLALIAESDLNDPRVVRSRENGGYGMDAQWSDDFHHSLHTVLSGENNGYYKDFGSLGQLAKCLKNIWVYDGCFSEYRGRTHGRPAAGLPGWKFFGFLQNHDQVGNRATGDRSSHLLSPAKQKIGAALLLTSPFLPMLFQGEEWGAASPFLYFTDHREDWVARAVSEGRRREFAGFGWNAEDVPDPQDPESFQRSKLQWQELNQHPHHDLYGWYKALIALRRAIPGLTNGDFGQVKVEFDESARWLYLRRKPVHIACNFGTVAQTVHLHRKARILLTSEQPHLHNQELTLLPESVTILENE